MWLFALLIGRKPRDCCNYDWNGFRNAPCSYYYGALTCHLVLFSLSHHLSYVRLVSVDSCHAQFCQASFKQLSRGLILKLHLHLFAHICYVVFLCGLQQTIRLFAASHFLLWIVKEVLFFCHISWRLVKVRYSIFGTDFWKHNVVFILLLLKCSWRSLDLCVPIMIYVDCSYSFIFRKKNL